MLTAIPLWPGTGVAVEVVIDEGTTLRGLAETYLDAPDAWKLILFYNGLDHPGGIRPGMRLTIPVALFREVDETLEAARRTARDARMEGAGVLARAAMEAANRQIEKALERKRRGDLADARKSAKAALDSAKTALSEARDRKIQSVTAVLARKQGTVQSRKPREPVWLEAKIDQLLSEQERLRTLVASRAGVQFVDGSEIHLSESSMAVIGEMKENLIKDALTVNVVVLQGDVLAHLSSLGGQKDFSITSPGIETVIRSKRFRASRDATNVTRIANYDGEIDVTARQQQVTVGKDEGTEVAAGRAPSAPRKLLPPPPPVSPLEHQIFFSRSVPFSWASVPDARAYVLEISENRDFGTLLAAVRLTGDQHNWSAPRRGVYYFRMHTVDAEGFAGPFSDPAAFFVNIDEDPPYLLVTHPADGARLGPDHEVTVTGTVETGDGVSLSVNGVKVVAETDGTFSHPLALSEMDETTVTVTATDRAGNRSTVLREVVRPDPAAALISLETPRRLTVNLPEITLRGTLAPGARLRIDDQPVGAAGRFAHVLPMAEGTRQVTLTAEAHDGRTETVTVSITVDRTPPEIRLDDPPPATRSAEITLSGEVSEPVTLLLNDQTVEGEAAEVPGEPTPVRFEIPLPLAEGSNVFHLTAIDRAGNEARRTLRVRRDTTPPTVDPRRSEVSPRSVRNGAVLTCRVVAEDDGVGLARTGEFTVTVGDRKGGATFSGPLILNRETGDFEGRVFIPPSVAGRAALTAVRVSDQLGNTAVWP